MCIFYKNKQNLTYRSREHIFPASIGGKTMLDRGVVSDEANNYFSPLELKIVHSSLPSLGRDFFGLGKQGSDKLPRQLKITTMEKDGKYYLCYMFKGTPYLIPQIRCDLKNCGGGLSIDEQNGEAGISTFLTKLEEFNNETKFVSIPDEQIPESLLLIGFFQGKYFVSSKVKSDSIAVKQNIGKFISEYRQQNKPLNKYPTENAIVTFKIEETAATSRVFMKIAFNVIAHYRGKDYVLNDNFDDARDWLMNPEREDNAYHRINYDKNPLARYDLTGGLKEHSCIISKQKDAEDNEVVFATVTLYGNTKSFVLGKVPSDDNYCHDFYGLVCDIETKQERDLMNKIATFALGKQG